MTTLEIVFVAARSAIVMLCALAVLIVWRHARAGTAHRRGEGRILAVAAGLMAAAALLTVNDLRAALSPGEQMASYAGAWLWLVFDAGVPLLMIRVLSLMRQRDAALAALEAASVTDALTGLANRRGFHDAARVALGACQRRGEPAAVIMLDLDRFKAINDGHGHAAGDAVLRDTAEAMRRHLRASDVVGRLGGEEFAVLCAGATSSQAAALADRMRGEISSAVPHPAGDAAAVTISAGVAAVEQPEAGPQAALLAADQALYTAKAAGRDRVVVADTLPAAAPVLPVPGTAHRNDAAATPLPPG